MLNDKVFSSRPVCGQLEYEKETVLSFNFAIGSSRQNFMGGWQLDPLNKREKVEFFNNEISRLYKSLSLDVQDILRKKLHAHIECNYPATWSSLENHIQEINKKRNEQKKRFELKMECPKGEIDLEKIYNDMNQKYFNGKLELSIAWSRNTASRKRSSILLGTFNQENRTVKISPQLKKDFVPRYFIEYIVYHEMLHSIFDFKRFRGRNQIHTPEFKAAEKKFEFYKEARGWLKENLNKLLA